MSGPYGLLFDRLLTRIDPERAHQLGFRAIRTAGPLLAGLDKLDHRKTRLDGLDRLDHRGRSVQTMGLTFPHPLGLAAGFDKNGVGIDALAALGFGHVEIGTVTAEPQPGNPTPRLFRLTADRAIVNRMGFNNDGAEAVARRLGARARGLDKLDHRDHRDGLDRLDHRDHRGGLDRLDHRDRRGGLDKLDHRDRRGGLDRLDHRDKLDHRGQRPVLGINIGKTKVVPEDAAVGDYERSTGLLAPYADYLVVNVSSPNTPGLRDLQAVEKLEPLLRAVRRRADEASPERRVPLLVKIAPDLADVDVTAVADLALAVGLDGIVATNTTIARTGLRSDPSVVAQAGGLSGPPVRERAEQVLRLLRARVGPDLTLVGVGGISTTADAKSRLAAGADLLQAYTAFVYEGPLWPRRIVRGLSA